MSLPEWNIEFFRLDSGRQPYLDFFRSLPTEDQARIRSKLDVVRQHGPQFDELSKHLADGIYELRIQVFSGIVRLFYFYQRNYTIVITHGICNKKQKTDRAEIEQARQYRGQHRTRG